MHTACLVVTLVAIAFNGFSGVSALMHFAPIIPGMEAAAVLLTLNAATFALTLAVL